MAKIIDTPDPVYRPGRAPKYPWDEWADGNWREAVAGEDFTCTVATFRNQLHTRARGLNLKASTRTVGEDRVQFRLYQPDQ